MAKSRCNASMSQPASERDQRFHDGQEYDSKQSFRGTKLVNGFEKSKHLEKLKLFV